MASDENNQTPNGVEVIRSMVRELPLSAGVYRMLGDNDAVLYVGKARQLRARVSHYTNLSQLPLRLQRMVIATKRMEIVHAASEAEALLLEASLIKSLKPKYNILLKDDKSFPFIHVSGHAFPRIAKHRGAKQEKGEYFGPFVSANAVNETITLLQRAFLLRPCSDSVFKHRTRPCLQYQIKRCAAPCVNYITEVDYAALVSQAMQFLKGHRSEIQTQLERDMQTASDAMEFERAGMLRDRLRALSHVQNQANTPNAEMADADVIALARAGAAVCVQVFTYRAGSNYGNRTYFPSVAEDEPDGEIIAAFIGQFYQRQPVPPLVLVNVLPQECEVLEAALTLLAKQSVKVHVPQRGGKRAVLELAENNAREALSRHLSEAVQQEALLAEVAEIFGLPAPPERIEVYDNSHVMGAHAVGAMVVAGPEGFDKKAYRIFGIKGGGEGAPTPPAARRALRGEEQNNSAAPLADGFSSPPSMSPGDDYAMLREVLTRRFKKMLESEEGEATKPDLVLIDGGAGQLSVAVQVLEALGISDVPLVAISKGPNRNAGREWFHLPGREAFQLPVGSSVLHYLQRLRDEAHRFAIGTHRNKRSKAAHASELDAISAIGPRRKKALLHHFGSVRAIAAASVEQVALAPGISKELAQKIHQHLNM